MFTTLVTGCNRGIGLEFVKQYAGDNWQVFACCRQPNQATELNHLARQYPNIKIFQLDITDSEQVATLVKTLAKTPIDLLINNAAVFFEHDDHYRDITKEQLLASFENNTVAPMLLTQALIPHIAASQLKKIVYLSSGWGSIAENDYGTAYAYRTSKAAGNCLMKNLSIDLKPQGIKVIVINPGWVKTDMGGPSAQITPTESVHGMRQVLEQSGEKTGVFYGHNGREIAW